MERYTIAPGGSAVFRLHTVLRTPGQPRRTLTSFREAGSERVSYVILAEYESE